MNDLNLKRNKLIGETLDVLSRTLFLMLQRYLTRPRRQIALCVNGGPR